MSDSLVHRGPDDFGIHVSGSAGFGMSHRRLSIIDISDAGRQPMVSASGRWVLAYNGEIYNTAELRGMCEPQAGFKGHCDAEVLCELIDRVGPANAARRSVGMFAFAAWDLRERVLHLVRDRVGIKPLYMATSGGTFAFASESTALGRVPGLCGGVSREGLAGLLRNGYLPGQLSILENVRKVQPGTMVSVRSDSGTPIATVEQWWSLSADHEGRHDGASGPELLENLEHLVDRCIKDRMVSDRPVGAFLSGGVDSSLVVSGMARLDGNPVRTYSIGFDDPTYDESAHARGVASHLGTLHEERVITEDDLLDAIPSIEAMFDEPFADSSQIPMAFLCRLAREEIVVALSGDGADELFGGYDRYQWCMRLWSRISGMPLPLRKAMAAGLAPIPGSVSSLAGRIFNGLLPARMRLHNPTDKMHRVRAVLASRNMGEMYRGLTACFADPGSVLLQDAPGDEPAAGFGHDRRSPIDDMMHADFLEYLPNDILVKVDRTSMQVGLEARVPLLDHRLVDLAYSLPIDFRIRGGVGKWPLRRILERRVPGRYWDRPKQGFGVPLGSWLRGPLRDWAEDLLSEDRIRRQGHFKPEAIRRLWDRHQRRAVDSSRQLWTLLMFQSWLER